MSFQKATKRQSKLRCALFGISGGGKTYSALAIAKGLGSKVAVIDTERGSASKYSDRFAFDVCELNNRTISGYIDAIKEAEAGGYDVLIIDSMTHAWEELLAEVDKLAATKYKGNSFRAWSEGTPKQRKFIDAILNFNGHLIATMRSKTEWNVESKDGRMMPQRVGLTPEQGKGIEYEFDLLLEISGEHFCTVLKDRTGKFQDVILEKPGEAFGKELRAWLMDGGPAAQPKAQGTKQPPEKTSDTGKSQDEPQGPSQSTMPIKSIAELANDQFKAWVKEGLITATNVTATIKTVAGKRQGEKCPALKDLTEEQINKIVTRVKGLIETLKETAGTDFNPLPVDPPTEEGGGL